MNGKLWIAISSAAASAFLSLASCDRGGEVATAAGGPSQEELAAAFEASKETLFAMKTPVELAGIRAVSQATIAPAENGLQVTATGNDPVLHLPPFAAGKRFILQVAIESPADGGIQLFHKVSGEADYGERRGPLYPLKQGRNTVYWRVDSPNVIDPLRLDPGYTPGTYVIESITARTLSN